MAAESTTNLSYQVSEIKSLMQDLRKQVQKLGEDGKGVVEVFKKIGDPFALQSKSIEELSAKIKEAKAEIVKNQAIQEKGGKQSSEAAAQQTASLNKLIGLEDQLQRAKGAVVREVQNVAKAEQKTRSLKQKGFEDEFNANSKIKSDNLELSAGETEINRILREKAANTASLNEEVYKRQEAEKAAVASEKEGAALKKQSLKEQADLERFMLEKSLKGQADKAIASEEAAAEAIEIEKRKVAEISKLSKAEALAAIEDSKKEQAADDALALKKIQTSKQSVNRRASLEKKYWETLQSRYSKDSVQYKALEVKKLAATAKYEKERNAVVNKFRKSRPKSTKEKGGFFSQFKDGLVSSNIGKTLGRLVSITSAVQLFRASLQVLKKALVSSFKASVDFEAQIAQLQAVTGKSNEEISRLEKSILSVAGSTKFTSEEIVQLQTELGKLGFTVPEIEAATLAIARTAQALGEKVGPVAQRIGQILNQFNLAAAETTRVSDSLVSVINSSALSFEGFSTALQYIGPLGAEVGTTFEETAVAMALLADNGFTASRIGTGLRGIMTELSKTGKDLNTVISELAEEEITLAEAVDLVGKRNAAQLLTLVKTARAQQEVGQSLDDLSDKYFSQGSAAIAAAQQVDTFQGNMDLLKSAVNRVQISFGNLLKTSKLLRFALRLIDEEGYNAAIAAEAIAATDPQAFSAGLSDAAEAIGEMKQGLDDVNTVKTVAAFKARKLVEETVIKPMEEELAYLKRVKAERISAIDLKIKELTAQRDALPLYTRDIALSKEREEIQNRIKRLGEEKQKRDKESIAEHKAIKDLEDKIQERKEEGFDAENEFVTKLILETGLQNALERERNDVIDERKGKLKELRDLRDEEGLDLKKANDVNDALSAENLIVQAKIDTLLAEQIKRKEDGNEILGEELLLFDAKLNQYKTEKDSLANLVFITAEKSELAQKEFELEFKQLANKIKARKILLEQEQAILGVEILTQENLAQNAETEKKRLAASETLNDLQQKKLANEKNAYLELNELTDEYGVLIVSIGKEVERAGLDGRFIEKAEARLESFKLSFNDLGIDLTDIARATQALGDVLADALSESLKDGLELKGKDLITIDSALRDLILELFPEIDEGSDAYNDLFQRLKPLLMSKLIPDSSETGDRIKAVQKALKLGLDAIADAAKAYNDTALENTQNRLDAELDSIRSRYKTEEDILKSQLDNQLITESQFRVKSNELKRKQIQEENEINKKKFEAEKKADLINVGVDTLEAVASNLINNYGSTDTVTATGLTLAGYAAIIGGGALKADAIRRRKFFPVKFEEGGLVQGSSHQDGGVPFTVKGQGGYEMEGGEFIVNKRAAQFHRSLLERINNSAKPNTNVSQSKFADGGLVSARRATQVNVTADTKESVNYLRAIAEASLSTAMNSNKPLRAFVSARDLRSSENERRLKERNDRI